MAADSNMGFHHDAFLASAINRHAVSFQSSAITSTSGMISLGNSIGTNSTLPLGNSFGMNSTSGMILTGLKHDTGLAVEWTPKEQSKLEEGLVRFADEPSILRYIKIAATLHDKTVRDVALRCRWMTKEKTGKRRKPEDHYTGKKMKDRKEKLMESSSKPSVPPASLQNKPAHPLMTHHMNHDRKLCEVPVVGSITKQLLDENVQVLGQISTNLLRFKVQDNINLFFRARNNITAILDDMKEMPGNLSQMPPLPVAINEELANSILPSASEIQDNINLFFRAKNNITAILDDMKEMPGIMSQMPPLPVAINEELANSILPSASETLMLGSPGGIHLKQESGC